MKILVSNDDGVHAPGLAALAACLAEFAQVVVVAPDRDRSAASNSLTLERPLRVRELENGFFAVQGTPTDCVHLALTGLMPNHFDLVITGINAGANLGDDVLYSGTVAAAMEGRFLALPAIAFSCVNASLPHLATAQHVVKQVVQSLIEKPLEECCLLNVNIPDVPLDALGGFEVCRLGKRHKAEPTIEGTDPRGRTIYWIGPPGEGQDVGEGTDFHAISQSRVSITPLQMDLTHYKQLSAVQAWLPA